LLKVARLAGRTGGRQACMNVILMRGYVAGRKGLCRRPRSVRCVMTVVQNHVVVNRNEVGTRVSVRSPNDACSTPEHAARACHANRCVLRWRQRRAAGECVRNILPAPTSVMYGREKGYRSCTEIPEKACAAGSYVARKG